MKTWTTTTCGPIPGGFILTHAQMKGGEPGVEKICWLAERELDESESAGGIQLRRLKAIFDCYPGVVLRAPRFFLFFAWS